MRTRFTARGLKSGLDLLLAHDARLEIQADMEGVRAYCSKDVGAELRRALKKAGWIESDCADNRWDLVQE